jgi:hypothetical protein
LISHYIIDNIGVSQLTAAFFFVTWPFKITPPDIGRKGCCSCFWVIFRKIWFPTFRNMVCHKLISRPKAGTLSCLMTQGNSPARRSSLSKRNSQKKAAEKHCCETYCSHMKGYHNLLFCKSRILPSPAQSGMVPQGKADCPTGKCIGQSLLPLKALPMRPNQDLLLTSV